MLIFSMSVLKSQTQSMIIVENSNTIIYSCPKFVYMDSLFRTQPGYQKLLSRSIIAPTIKEESIELIKQGDFLKCLSPENALIVSNSIIRIRLHVFLNENAELQAVGISFTNNLIVLDETEFICLLDFIKTLQFDFQYKPEGEFISGSFFHFRITM